MGLLIDKASAALANARSLGDECGRIFTKLDEQRILADADALESRTDERNALPLYGLTVSLKDLFDEAGEVTTAGSLLFKSAPPAKADATVVSRLKAAGALIFGRTNMTEFAYSGIGINPHNGTPGCFFNPALVPGGSSSGAGVSVAHGLCDIAMGTDTGGSVRIPAAVNGLYGYKPTQTTIPLAGVHPLSSSFDSVGPLTTSLERTIRCLNVIRDEPLSINSRQRSLRLAIPADTFTDGLDSTVAKAFEEQCQCLAAAGHQLEAVSLRELIPLTPSMRLMVSSEAMAIYKDHLDTLETQGDSRVLARIRQCEDVTAADLQRYTLQREEAVNVFSRILQPYDALLSPTLMCERPSIDEVEKNFNAHNASMLRNTTYVNLTDGCALTIPVRRSTLPPSALMVCGPNMTDNKVLGAASIIDTVLREAI